MCLRRPAHAPSRLVSLGETLPLTFWTERCLVAKTFYAGLAEVMTTSTVARVDRIVA